MVSRKELQEKFNSFLAEQQLVKEPELLYQPIKYTLDSGGKRIRPVLLMMSCEMMGGVIQEALYPALGLEMFHNYTLLHDDIMDNSAIRRGEPTVHAKWNDNVAILSGDAMSIMASQFVLKTPRNHKQLLEAFNQAAIDVCEGQQYDMDFENLKMISESEYMKMISLKTGALLAVSLQMGAIISNANNSDVQKLYDFGMKMGIGFQLQDDWLDCFGNQDKFGKLIGKDILNEKKTFLFIKAYELANDEQKNMLNHAFNTPDLPADDKIRFVLDVYNQLNIGDLTIEKASRCFSEAEQALDSVCCKEEMKSELKQFLEYLRNRSY